MDFALIVEIRATLRDSRYFLKLALVKVADLWNLLKIALIVETATRGGSQEIEKYNRKIYERILF